MNLAARRGLVADHDGTRRVRDAPPSGAPSSNAVPRRGLPPPLLACAASAGARTFEPNDSSTASSDPTSLVRATSRRRGGTTHATSAPFENTICPRAHDENVLAREVGADRTEVLGRRHRRRQPRATRRPVDESPAAAPARESAPSTMRVAAIGDSALTVTPRGVAWPMRHVSAATARLAQLYAPASAARHPEPDVTPRMRPWPAAAMSGSAARSTLR